jgi:hypothetical protein
MDRKRHGPDDALNVCGLTSVSLLGLALSSVYHTSRSSWESFSSRDSLAEEVTTLRRDLNETAAEIDEALQRDEEGSAWALESEEISYRPLRSGRCVRDQ